MSVQASTWVIKNSRHKGSALLLLLMIANHAHADGTNAFPSVKTLAEECRMSERQVIRLIASLERSGELMIERSRGGKTHNYSINMTTANPDKLTETHPDKLTEKTLTNPTPNPDKSGKRTLTNPTPPLNKDEHLLEQSVNKEEGTLLGETQKLIGFPLDNHTAERILAVIDSRFEKQWLDLVSNRMLGLRDAHKNYIQTRIGYWLSDYQNSLWRFEKDAERKNGTSQKLSERDKSAQRTINAERMANAIATGDEAALRDILGGDGQDHSSGYLPS